MIETIKALPAPQKVLLLPAPTEPQPEEAPVAAPEVKIENGKEVVYQNNIVKRNNYRKLTNRRQGNNDEYGNMRKPRNLNTTGNTKGYTNHYAKDTTTDTPALSKDDITKAIKWLEKVKSGEWTERNLKPEQITRIYDTWKSFNNGKVPTDIEKLYNKMILNID